MNIEIKSAEEILEEKFPNTKQLDWLTPIKECMEAYHSQFKQPDISKDSKMSYPKEWEPSKIDSRVGWKNRSKILAEITSAVNDEIYIEDENEFMEKVDVVLEYLKTKYQIKNINQ